MFNDHTEWMLNPKIFNKISTLWGPFDIDIFASRLNKQWPKYVAWKPDPNSEFIDAFSVNLSKFYFYAFPPWYTSLLELLVDVPRIIRKDQGWLKLPHSEKNGRWKWLWRDVECLVKFQEQGISRDVLQIMKESWRGSTRNQYATVIKWTSFCGERRIHLFQPTVNNVLQFLLKFYKGI